MRLGGVYGVWDYSSWLLGSQRLSARLLPVSIGAWLAVGPVQGGVALVADMDPAAVVATTYTGLTNAAGAAMTAGNPLPASSIIGVALHVSIDFGDS